MLRISKKFQIEDPKTVKFQLLSWAQQFEEVVWLDSNDHEQQYASYDAILAADAFTALKTDHVNAFEKLQEYQELATDWLFGYLSYDLKNDLEALSSENFDGLQFPELYFFQPKKLFLLQGKELEVHYLRMVEDELMGDVQAIMALSKTPPVSSGHPPQGGSVKIKLRIHKDEYFSRLKRLLAHIHRGDIYEANFCQEFYTEDSQIDPLQTYAHLNAISKPPFATFVKLEDAYLLSASPERFLRKQGRKVISQPIKGTAKRSRDIEADQQLREALGNDQKERSENIMIVDLVRNDLSRTATKGSVSVEELCKVYTFDQVHQMVSTVVSEVSEEISPVTVIKSCFPMGSMTGAPKVSAMRIIEALEETKRGLYSGAVGYFTAEGDFDFNVVIRSILYNHVKRYVSYSVGGAITARSIPQKEYEECLLKAKAMREVLERW